MVRTLPFQGGNEGSNPFRNTSRSKSAVDGTVWGGEDVGSIPTFWTWSLSPNLWERGVGWSARMSEEHEVTVQFRAFPP